MLSPDASRLLRPERETCRGAPYDAAMWADRASRLSVVALAFAEAYPDRLERIVAISAPHETHPMTTALRALQRQIVELGLSTGETREAMAIARGLAMTTYRSREEFAERFDSAPVEQGQGSATFPVEGYLRAHGERFAARWTAERAR